MATNWLKSLSCKSNAVADGVSNPKPLSKKTKKTKNPHPLAACRSSDSVKDVLSPFPKHPSSPLPKIPSLKEPKPKPKSRPSLAPPVSMVMEAAPPANSFPALEELPEGHSSRRVVEIIFRSSWGRPPFAGEIEMLFRVRHPPRAAARFEEYRSAVRASAAASCAARCAADGNEMMLFHCAPAGGGEVYDAAAWGKAGEGIRTFDGSGGAHASGAGGAGRGAMLLCRVIAGRVRTGSQPESESRTGFDSVRVGKGELLVLDPGAVLPCFLIIYKI